MNGDRRRLFTLRLALALAWLLVAPAHAQMLWSVEGPQGQQNWLLGTVHSEDPRLLEFAPEVLAALEQSSRLALELVPDMAMLEQLNQAMHYDQPRLHEVLDGELYRQLVAILEAHYGMGEPAVRRLRPWAAAMTISVPPPQTGLFMDLALAIRAGSLGLDVVALERLDEQLDFLAGMSKSMQLDLLAQAVADHDRQGELFEQLITIYLDGDLDDLEAVAEEQMADLDPALREHFEQIGMIRRNHTMVDRATDWLEAGGLMIAVGALHLPGEDGLIELLRARGFDVAPVSADYFTAP
ncbi:MAG: TraB/GumN family protein [Wenzhouxiangella sp.]|nr:MAG: TraB/GumN family protein [Wenzhouxiangella sp.]